MLPSTSHLLVAAVTALSPGASTQSLRPNESTSIDDCPQNVRSIADGETLFNSTGVISLIDPTDTRRLTQRNRWYLSMLLSDIRITDPEAGHPQQLLDVFLSVPSSGQSINATEAEDDSTVCGYRLHGQNAVSDHPQDAERSCEGILSEECLTLLQSLPVPAADGCPRPPRIDAVCGEGGTFSWTADPINVFNSTCGLDDLPHIELPQGYRSLSTQLGGGFRNLGEFTDETYDLRVRQPIPIVLTGRANAEDRQGWSRVLCLAPDDIVPGSRVPEGDFPGGAGRTGAKIWLALVTTLAVAASIT